MDTNFRRTVCGCEARFGCRCSVADNDREGSTCKNLDAVAVKEIHDCEQTSPWRWRG
ncbi:MAG: hypothetical protein ABFD79_01540 [Phycisphaerales bacterium]